eukprot:6209700-Pleurochrysis_carterae.AAC.7
MCSVTTGRNIPINCTWHVGASRCCELLALTIRFLATSAGARTAELLRLAAARIRNQEAAIITGQNVLDLTLGGLVHVCRHRDKKQGIERATQRAIRGAELQTREEPVV